ncbi:hypothetical protein [Flavivirga spongiicola]|uniref:Uncharacterized protein n=1 Tax=Flavivirga spongiicola TaxID=421621 RepID=A0ABU7XTI9_9FLAO|nr:hypothetical protein [Flavivirga sp. MEBiC05379]MDO5979078.1 hypothetical protein [Flavivirga sp. MEBiC05379]
MENRTEFNLENNIQQWKSSLTKKNNLTKSNIIELENHLSDLIDDLESKGLNKEESFIIARKRIGKTDDICLEFDKVNNDFSFINKSLPYLKGALICIAFIILSKLFLIITLLLSQKLSIDETTFSIISILILVFTPILFFNKIFFNFKHGKPFLSKLTNVNVLVALILISSVITFRLSAQVVLPGINTSEVADFYTMEINFTIYKMLSGFILLTTSLIFFWRNKKYNKLKYTE